MLAAGCRTVSPGLVWSLSEQCQRLGAAPTVQQGTRKQRQKPGTGTAGWLSSPTQVQPSLKVWLVQEMDPQLQFQIWRCPGRSPPQQSCQLPIAARSPSLQPQTARKPAQDLELAGSLAAALAPPACFSITCLLGSRELGRGNPQFSAPTKLGTLENISKTTITVSVQQMRERDIYRFSRLTKVTQSSHLCVHVCTYVSVPMCMRKTESGRRTTAGMVEDKDAGGQEEQLNGEQAWHLCQHCPQAGMSAIGPPELIYEGLWGARSR
ncbi:uncharacterized protein LOC104860728 isoform X2 [Fukomys damarensis]|nr:uncharacterized protein LOC104860728 isoform X2 [Fukomys damarensis]